MAQKTIAVSWHPAKAPDAHQFESSITLDHPQFQTGLLDAAAGLGGSI